MAPIYDLSYVRDWTTLTIWRRGSWHSIRTETDDRERAGGRVALPQWEADLADAVEIHEKAIEALNASVLPWKREYGQWEGLTYTALEVVQEDPVRVRMSMFACTEPEFVNSNPGSDRPPWFSWRPLIRYTAWARVLGGIPELDEVSLNKLGVPR